MGGRSKDGVDVRAATPAELSSFVRVGDQLAAFRVPRLYDSNDSNRRVFFALFDGTGNDLKHSTNVALLNKQIEEMSRKNPNIGFFYKEGPGTQGGLTGLLDGITGGTYIDRIEAMYVQFDELAARWLKDNPKASISVISVGFSRGAEQAAGFTRLVDERGIQNPAARIVDRFMGDIEQVYYVAPPLRPGGTIPQAIGLYDPVATGEPEAHDRRPPPSVVSGFQIKARNEHRALFPSTTIIQQGISSAGRFLGVTTPGAHSDIGGGYELDGLSRRNFNLMATYLNATLGETLIRSLKVTPSSIRDVIHDSTQHQWFYQKDKVRQSVVELDPIGKLIEPVNQDLVTSVSHQPDSKAEVLTDKEPINLGDDSTKGHGKSTEPTNKQGRRSMPANYNQTEGENEQRNPIPESESGKPIMSELVSESAKKIDQERPTGRHKKTDAKPFHQTVAENLIEQLKAGTAPWQRPWTPDESGAFMPTNPTTGNRYKGINAIHLMSQGYSDQRWMTYKQASSLEAQVKKGEKGTAIQYWKFTEEQTVKDAAGKPLKDGNGESIKRTVTLERPKVFFATVFNAEQIDGLAPLQPRQPPEWNVIDRAEQILKASGAIIRHGGDNRAFYRPSTDTIQMPDKGQFPTANNYYATALHELGHWTGHKSRLDRDLSHPFGSEGYAKEELRAEIASMIVGGELGIGHDPGQHAAYVGSWVKVLQNEPMEIFRAAADAEKIHDFVLAFEQKQVQEQTTNQNAANELDSILLELQELHQSSVAGYSPLESWENIKGTAIENGFMAAITRSQTSELGAPYLITYTDTAGADNGISTELHVDGKAATSLNGNRVNDSLFSADHESQSLALKTAFTQYSSQKPKQEMKMDLLSDGQLNDLEKAEAWMMKHIESETLPEKIVTASLEQLNRMDAIINRMLPLNTTNDFWASRELPKDIWAYNEKIDRASEAVDARLMDAHVAASRHDPELFLEKTMNAFDLTLPADWNGNIKVHPNILETINGTAHVSSAEKAGVEPEFWSVYGQKADGTFEWLADTENRQLADELAERLAMVDANSETNELERAAKLARIIEERVSRDPKSTNEDISAAREARKSADSLSVQNDTDLQRRIAEIEREQKSVIGSTLPEKTMLNVPFKQKDEAKGLGAKWDRQEQSWYVPAGVDQAPFAKWMTVAEVVTAASKIDTPLSSDKKEPGRQYLAVPYGERGVAKAAGAKWDKSAKSWYAGDKADMAKLERWKPDNILVEQVPAMSPREEFSEALQSLGCIVTGKHPVMDGQKHRIPVEGDKKGEQAGFYVGHLDGLPAGYIKNNKTGIEMKWKSKGYVLDPEQKAKLQAEAAEKLQAREAEQARLQERTAERVSKQLVDLVMVVVPTPYMTAKGIEPRSGLYTDAEGQKTYIPAIDADGKQWTMQYIQEDGTKRFAKDSKKEGCFHVVGGLEALAEAPAIVIGEGYATANSLSQALGYAAVAAFDSGNLPHVAKALQAKYPDKPIIIAGDDDKHLEVTQGINPGRSKADGAAKLVGGARIFPIFAPGEQAGNPKGFTDFNDLATKSVLGKEGIERQVNSYVGSIVAKQTVKLVEQKKKILQQSEPEEVKRRSVKI